MHKSSPPEMQLGYLDQQLDQKRQVKMKTCADVYNYWRNYKRLYKKAPKDGIEFQVEYIDTGLALSEEERAKAPIALALHGAPGSYHDFAMLIQHLSKQNVRVIAPNFPEYVATVKTKVLFRHSADEKAAYLRDFLKSIQVTKIDLLISHSSAIFPTLLILLNANNEAIAKRKTKHSNDNISHGCNITGELGQVKRQNIDDATTIVKSNNVDRNNNNSKIETYDSSRTCRAAKDCNKQINDVDRKENTPKSNLLNAKDDKKKRRKQRRIKKQLQDQKDENDDDDDDDDVIVEFDQPIEIKAVALFNPAGHRLPKSMKPTWFKCGSVRIYQYKLGRSLFGKLGPAFLTVVGVPVKVDNMDNVMLSATVMRNSRCHRVVKQLERLSQMRLPTLLVFSEEDKLIEKEIFYEMAQFMKLDREKFDIFNNEGNLIDSTRSKITSKEDWIRVMVFKAGGHYTYSNYSKVVNEAVSDLLDKVTTSQDQDNKQQETTT